VPEPIFDRRDQLETVQSGLLQGEEVLAVYDCVGAGTGFLGLTTLRIVLQDKSFVGKKNAITSIPYRRIRSVSVVSDKSIGGKFFSSSSIAIDAGGTTHQADFRGDDKALNAHNMVLWYITR
jgi:hypothetical protein